MNVLETLLLPLFVSAVCDLALFVIALRRRSSERAVVAILQLSIFAPLASSFVCDYSTSVTIGYVLAVALGLLFAITSVARRASLTETEFAFGLLYILAFAWHVCVLSALANGM